MKSDDVTVTLPRWVVEDFLQIEPTDDVERALGGTLSTGMQAYDAKVRNLKDMETNGALCDDCHGVGIVGLRGAPDCKTCNGTGRIKPSIEHLLCDDCLARVKDLLDWAYEVAAGYDKKEGYIGPFRYLHCLVEEIERMYPSLMEEDNDH